MKIINNMLVMLAALVYYIFSCGDWIRTEDFLHKYIKA